MFVSLMADLRATFTERWLKLQIEIAPPPGVGPRGPTATGPAGGRPPGRPSSDLVSGPSPRRATPMVASKAAAEGLVGGAEGGAAARQPGGQAAAVAANPYAGVGRNDPCPCGSGKKFKKCHGATP
jgi:preprotein translocase subunit SecA